MFRKLKTLSLITLITLNFHSVFAQNVQIIYKVLDARLLRDFVKQVEMPLKEWMR